ncbi:MAG TPA: hypothetical protein VFA02_08055 [Pseudacidobacterium sp.]|nr:hypothetical protein [Pseudacidobacterium sp.]
MGSASLAPIYTLYAKPCINVTPEEAGQPSAPPSFSLAKPAKVD